MFFKNNKKHYKYEISICAFFKNESKFLDEWIKYHISIGINHFYLYNNNSTDNYFEVLLPYINNGIISLNDFPVENGQMLSYEECYKKYKFESHWIAFIDIDEFLCPLNDYSLHDVLISHKNYPNIAIYWKMFGSNNLKNHNYNKYVTNQYFSCWPLLSTHTKMICNMNFPISNFHSPHYFWTKIFGIKVPPINQFKKIMWFNLHFISKINLIQLNHYWNKADDTFFERVNNGVGMYNGDLENTKNIKKSLLKSHENLCTSFDYNILKHLNNIT